MQCFTPLELSLSAYDYRQIIEEILGDKVQFNHEDLLNFINSMFGEKEFTLEEARAAPQKNISHALDAHLLEVLKESAENDREKARLNSVSMQHSGDWLNAVPVKALGLHLRPLEFRASIRYRLGVPVYRSPGPCLACDMAESDVIGGPCSSMR